MQSMGGTVGRSLQCILFFGPDVSLQTLQKLTTLLHWKQFPRSASEEKVINQ